MHLFAIPVLVFALGQDANQAEKAFRAAEKTLAEADTVQIAFDGVAKGKEAEMKLKGTILIAKGNKSRAEMTGEFRGEAMKWTALSDGQKMKNDITIGKKKEGSVKDTPKNANAMMAVAAARTGILYAFMTPVTSGPGQKPPEPDELFTASDFSFGPKEKIGTRQAQRIDYKLAVSAFGKKKTIDAQVWLDSETNLPLKRAVAEQEGNEKIQHTETYDMRVNAKIDPKLFELPK